MGIAHDLIDPDAIKIVLRLVRHKYQAYLVGGCVRDLLLQRTPKDFDIATSATPPEIKALFRNCRIIGRRFRLAHIFFGPKIIETATFRANPREVEGDPTGEGASGPEAEEAAADLLIRRDNVFGNAEEDARRRDFTINGLFYDLEADQVIDYVGGLADLLTRTVRTIGDADIRFREDPVRILRAIKFAARLDFTIEPAAWQAILDHKGEIPKCAPPRVLEEFYRLLRGGAARRSMELMRDTGVLELLVPELYARISAGPDSAEATWWWQALERIDRVVATRMEERLPLPSNAVLLCAIVAPFIGREAFEDSDKIRDIGQLIEERTRPLFEQMHVSRRDNERARQILLGQRRLAPSQRRRSRPMALVRRDHFQESLLVFELLAPIMHPGSGAEEELAKWQKMADEAARGGPPGADFANDAGPAEGDEPRKRRRRRRGGRRRKRPEGGPPSDVATGSEG